jgi:tetratricopeptide (TPR) repeat protein
MLIDSLIIGKYDILEEGINRLLKIPKRPEFKSIKNIESRVFRQRYLLLLNWSLRQKEFEKAMEWMPDIENGLEQFGTKIEKHHRITFYYLNAYLCFQNQLYEDALKWNNYILNTKKEDVVKEVFHFARDLNLLIHYELGNYDLLESLLQSTPQYLRSRRPIYTTEKALFRVLGKLLKSIDNREKQTIIHQFRIEINQLAENPKEKRVFNFLDLRFWPSNSH